MRRTTWSSFAVCCLWLLSSLPSQGEVMLQWFETEWDEMYRKLPLAASIGYDYLWIPPPTKAPTGLGTKWGNVGYSLYDRFDLGDVPQRGSWATRYGTRGSLRNMVDAAHRLDVRIIPDIVMNHTGNGPDIRYYPGMSVEDFHVQWSDSYCNDLDYKRPPQMYQWYHNYGYGGTMWQDLANLADIRTEDHWRNGDPLRFTGAKTIEGVYWDFVGGRPNYWRQVGRYEYYPYSYTNDMAADQLYRWIVWLGNAIDYDGLRLDAAKHSPKEFFGPKAWGFLHEAQYNFTARRGYNFADDPRDLWQNYVIKTNALIFAEILSPWSEISQYWASGADANPMRYLDYQIKKAADSALNGSIGNFFMNDFGPNNGIMYIWGHDEGPGSKADLGYAYILTHIGMPMVYYTGNNINWSDSGRDANHKTWMIPGYDSKALGEQYNDVANAVWVHQQFARGSEADRWHDSDFLALERYDSTASAGKGLLLVALNDAGYDLTKTLTGLNFADGTVLHDYSGHNGANVTSWSGSATVTVPANSGQGWVFYAPLIPENLNVRVLQGGSDAPTMTWVIPGGTYIGSQTQQITRITSTNFTVDFTFRPPAGGSVDSAMMRWAQGRRFTTNVFDDTRNTVSGQFEKMETVNSTNWNLAISTNLPEGLTSIKCRAFVSRPGGYPALFNTYTKIVYVDQKGPQLTIWPPNSATVVGDCVMVISNSDFTAYQVWVGVDGTTNAASEVYKGLWKYNLTGLGAGAHTITVKAYEADWANTRGIINTSLYAQTLNVTPNPYGISFNATAEGGTNKIPFFVTGVNATGTPSDVKLYWDGYELRWNSGNYSNTFNGEVIFRDYLGHVQTDRLWGAFVNGDHFFEAVRVDGTSTSRATRKITFNLYGINAIDADGDSLPDNLEMPFIDTTGAPGADQPWPGDNNRNFIPESGEYWTRLNPYNHSTFYSGTWDDRNDFDGDTYDNGTELMAGYTDHGNIYYYNIYDANSKPSGVTPTNTPSAAQWTPSNAVRGATMTITYYANGGSLSNKAAVSAHIGYSKRTLGAWTNVFDTNMTSIGSGVWQVSFPVWTNGTSVDFTFWDAVSVWDGKDWQATVAGGTGGTGFTMDGDFDGANGGEGYTVFPDAMKILAAFNSNILYVATWSTEGNDVFVYVTDQIGDAKATPWAKAGYVFFDNAQKPYLAAESDAPRGAWLNHVTGSITNGTRPSHPALEAKFNVVDAFGYVPEAVYIASVAYTNWDGGGVSSQGPYAWDSGNNIDALELLRVPIASITDNNLDGVFDNGKPQMWTAVNGNTNDANYGLRRIFLNELAGDSQDITVILQPNATGTLSDVELFSNLNRRDFAVLPGDEDPDTVTTASGTTYYRAYPMTSIGGGRYAYTINVNKCGAYRINARYKVNGGSYVYYTDNGLRRDCAVVASPKKALDLTMYELNPMIAEANTADFNGRSTFEDIYTVNTDRQDALSTNGFLDRGVNMVWLQPIHPIGSENRQTDPDTGAPYDPGSPYAVRNYWKVNSVLGDPSSEARAMIEFTNFVSALDAVGVGVMLDGTFNHSAWDCEIGEPGVTMGITTNPSTLIRDVRPQWYSKYNSYGDHATYYFSAANNDLAPAPDRMDFGKWNDAADFYFGRYDALVQSPPANTNWAWSSGWYSRYLLEDDLFEGFETNATRELWQYFSEYPIYWLEKTGHPADTPKAESWRGIDGLRCDFAQGLPSLFWEYTINKTRSVKWDFIFMAESLDGFRTVGTNSHHGVGFRSARHFDILNENMIFYWRDNFFSYYTTNAGQNATTYPTWQAFDSRRQAFDVSPLLLDLVCHDEIYPHDAQWRVIYAYAICAAMDGVPMVFYGQEAGAQNDASYYTGRGINALNNAAKYEVNFSKGIPNFKRYNHMTNIWSGFLSSWKTSMYNTYKRVNWARQHSPALRSQNNYMLNGSNATWNAAIFCVAKFQYPGVSAASQDVVFCAINNDYQDSTNRWDRFNLDVDYTPGVNWFGILSTGLYNVVDLASATPTNYLWGVTGVRGSVVKTNFWVILNGNPYEGTHVQYLKLVDMSATYPTNYATYKDWDWDYDGLPNWWELANGLNPYSGVGNDGAGGDKDGDHVSNEDEMYAGTAADDPDDYLYVSIDISGGSADVTWPSKIDVNYYFQQDNDLLVTPDWQNTRFATALSTNETVSESIGGLTNRFYRVRVIP